MGKDTEKLKLLFQNKSKIGQGSALLALITALVYLSVDIGSVQEKIENLEKDNAETTSTIRDIDDEINAVGLINSREHNDFTNDIVLIHERLGTLREKIDSMEKRIHTRNTRKSRK